MNIPGRTLEDLKWGGSSQKNDLEEGDEKEKQRASAREIAQKVVGQERSAGGGSKREGKD